MYVFIFCLMLLFLLDIYHFLTEWGFSLLTSFFFRSTLHEASPLDSAKQVFGSKLPKLAHNIFGISKLLKIG